MLRQSLHLTAALSAVAVFTSCAHVSPQVPQLTPIWAVNPSGRTPAYYINSVAISGDATRVVTGTFFHSYASNGRPDTQATPPPSESGTFGTYCYTNTGTLAWKDEFSGWQGVYWVDLSTDGQWAASGGWFSQKPYAGFVRAYDARTGNRVLDYRTAARVNQVCLSSDGTYLVSAADTIVLFERRNGVYQKVDEYTSPQSKNTIETISLSASGRRLVAGDYAGNVLMFTISGGKLGTPSTWKLPGSGGYSHSVRVTPDGTALVAGGSAGNVYFFTAVDFIAGAGPTASYQIPGGSSVYGVAVAADASGFVGLANKGSSAGSVYYLARQGNTATLKWSFTTQHNPNCVSFNSVAGLLVVADGHPDGSPGTFYLLDSATGTLLGQFGTDNMSWPVSLSANGKAFAAGSDNGNTYYFVTGR